MKTLWLSLLFLPVLVVSACGNTRVLGIPKNEAAEQLRGGNRDFIFRADLPAGFSQSVSRLTELFALHGAAPFYAALQAAADETADGGENNGRARNLEPLLLFAALESPLEPARREAAKKLVPLLLGHGDETLIRDALQFLDSGKLRDWNSPLPDTLRAACLYKLKRFKEAAETAEFPAEFPDDQWGRLIRLFAAWNASGGEGEYARKARQEIAEILFRTPQAEVLAGESPRWAAGEALAREGLLDPSGTAALKGRLAGTNYRRALELTRPALADGGLVFLRYPELLGDLGRAFQYAAPDEGAELFATWLRLLDDPPTTFTPPAFTGNGENSGSGKAALSVEAALSVKAGPYIAALTHAERNALRYPLLFYSGRLERARGNLDASSGYFGAALDIAPDDTQSDACIWYTLMNAARESSSAAALCVDTMPRWKDISYFSDVLDQLAGRLVAERRWDSLLDIFNALERAEPGPSLSQYAWILGRAAREGYITTGYDAARFFKIAFEAGEGFHYYRIMAAAALGLKLVPDTETAPREKTNTPETGFILGFFEYGAASFAPPYIESREKELSRPDLRKIAAALAARGEWRESLNLVSRYTGPGKHGPAREDLALFYPRPFRELTEKYARKAGIDEELFYGLIRTESYFQPRIVSRAGANGLTQLMLPTALDMAGRIARQGGPDYRNPGDIDLGNPEINLHIGSYYLNYLNEQMGNPMLALLAYNGGMGRVRRWAAANRQRKDSLPYDLFLETVELPETREYGRRVLSAAAVYGYLYYGTGPEKTAAAVYGPEH